MKENFLVWIIKNGIGVCRFCLRCVGQLPCGVNIWPNSNLQLARWTHWNVPRTRPRSWRCRLLEHRGQNTCGHQAIWGKFNYDEKIVQKNSCNFAAGLSLEPHLSHLFHLNLNFFSCSGFWLGCWRVKFHRRNGACFQTSRSEWRFQKQPHITTK